MASPRSADGGRTGGGVLLWVLAIIVMAVMVAGILVAASRDSSSFDRAVDQNSAAAPPTADDNGDGPGAVQDEPAPGFAPLEGVYATPGSPWAPGTTMHLTADYPDPGVPFQVSECTVAFGFSDSAGNAYAVTASHCGSVGDLVWPTNATTVVDYATEVGRVIYSDLDEPREINHDIGIIAVTDPNRMMTFAGDGQQPSLVAGGERFADQATAPEQACKIGGTTGLTCGETGQVQRQQLYDEDGSFVLTEGATASICAAKGDSGGPVVGEVDGISVILGLLSGTRTPEAPVADCGDPGAELMTVAYTPATTIVETIREVVPDAQLPPAEVPVP